MQWQWNHYPAEGAWSLTERPGWLRLRTTGITENLHQARGMLTQRIFADPDKLPVYLHCNIGTDRTGMVSYLLGTLLGIPQEDLYRDYLFSNFASIDGRRSLSTITGKYQKNLLSYHQKNLYLDAREYLKDCGCSDSELDAIVDAFIDFRAL